MQDLDEAGTCALMMAQSEPWKTLGRDYEASLRSISDPAKEVYVALAEGTIAGFVVINMHGAFIGYIQSVCVAPEQRGRGTGSALLGYAEQRILRETPNVFMCVSSFNPNALRLYKRLGYVVVGELHDYIVTGHSEILLRKTVGPLQDFTARPGE